MESKETVASDLQNKSCDEKATRLIAVYYDTEKHEYTLHDPENKFVAVNTTASDDDMYYEFYQYRSSNCTFIDGFPTALPITGQYIFTYTDEDIKNDIVEEKREKAIKKLPSNYKLTGITLPHNVYKRIIEDLLQIDPIIPDTDHDESVEKINEDAVNEAWQYFRKIALNSDKPGFVSANELYAIFGRSYLDVLEDDTITGTEVIKMMKRYEEDVSNKEFTIGDILIDTKYTYIVIDYHPNNGISEWTYDLKNMDNHLIKEHVYPYDYKYIGKNVKTLAKEYRTNATPNISTSEEE